MKKTVAVLLLLTTVTVFFCASNVFAATYISNRVTSNVSSNVTITASATIYNFVSSGAFNAYNGYYPIVVHVQIYNGNDDPALVNNSGFTFNFASGSANEICGVESLSTDFVLNMYSGQCRVVPGNNEYSYGNGLIVPPKTSVFCVGVVYVGADLVSVTPEAINLTSISIISNYSVAVSSVYPNPNKAEDLSLITAYLQTIANNSTSTDLDINDIKTEITNIYNSITYTGGNPNNSAGSGYVFNQSSYSYIGSIGGTANARYLNPYFISTDFEYNATSDTYTQIGSVRYDGLLTFSIWNTTSDQYRGNSYILVKNIFPSGINTILDMMLVNGMSYVQRDGQNLRIFFDNNESSYGYLPAGTIVRGYIRFHFDVPSGTSVTFPAANSFSFENWWGDSITSDNSGYHPMNEYQIMKDLYLAYVSVNSASIDSGSSQIGTTSDNIHQQEMQYYSDNDSAINATGLVNYRFDTQQVGGLNVLRNDFVTLWNALGNWNTVYVFSLTLGVALTIIRHAPAGIRSYNRRKNKDG